MDLLKSLLETAEEVKRLQKEARDCFYYQEKSQKLETKVSEKEQEAEELRQEVQELKLQLLPLISKEVAIVNVCTYFDPDGDSTFSATKYAKFVVYKNGAVVELPKEKFKELQEMGVPHKDFEEIREMGLEKSCEYLESLDDRYRE